MSGMMKDIIQESKPDEGSSGRMCDMGGVMGMMKMMEHCNDMMKSMQEQAETTKNTEKK